jgi:fused signal recognition particle receptor
MLNWWRKLKQATKNTSNKISGGIDKIFRGRKLDSEALEELEELLITADVGVDNSTAITSELSRHKFTEEITPEEIKKQLASIIAGKFTANDTDENARETDNASGLTDETDPSSDNSQITSAEIGKIPHVIMISGVNGNGKTTSLAKLAYKYKASGNKVLIAACDTFRAAAVEQLQKWGEKLGLEVFAGEFKADPASVAYKACNKAIMENFDVVLIDTAGRLHNQSNLMDQLGKIPRVLKKLDASWPNESYITLDATTGQNALKQVEEFSNYIKLSGIIATKLDASAKAGSLIAISQKFNLAVKYIGIGEGMEDLRPFSPDEFARSLVGLEE